MHNHNHNIEISTCDPLKYKTSNSIRILPTCNGKSIRIKSVLVCAFYPSDGINIQLYQFLIIGFSSDFYTWGKRSIHYKE